MSEDLNSRFLRVNAITVDVYGVDPLLDKVAPLIHNIRSYENHTVTQADRGAPELIALQKYGTQGLWWVIMEYNSIGRFQSLVEGLTIRIPDAAELTSAFVAAGIARDVVQRVITI